MKPACAFQGSMEFHLTLAPTKSVREPPTRSRACRHNETARKRASQLLQLQKGKDIALQCSTIRCARDDDECGFHRALARSNGDESRQLKRRAPHNLPPHIATHNLVLHTCGK